MYQFFPKPVDQAERNIDPQPETGPLARRLSRRAKGGIAAVSLGVLALVGIKGFGGQEAKADAPPIPTVTVSAPLQRSIVEWDDYVGRFEASQSVEIRPRVSGQLQAIHFRDGDIVQKGQLLFTIDQRPFLASLNEARARAASAQTQLALARSELARASRLVDDDAVSQEEVDTLRAAARSAEAGVAAANAVIRQRALDVEFTQVRAPVTGRISDRRVDIGNLVSANESMLTTVLALDPIYFSFDGSEALYLKSLREKQAGKAPDQQAEIRLQDEAGYSWKGRVDFTDNAINPGSGTMRGRAVVSNPDYFLAPGMFGNMRLSAAGTRDALLIPDAAVQTDQTRKVVYVVGKDGSVAVRPVEIGPLVNGLRSVRSGLGANDKVVISGVQFAQPGSKVATRPGKVVPPAQAGPAASFSAPAASQATLATR
ncbi:efflux RND transporter periplasmic adaptor subunit [Sphingomonas cavernae]|uniref:Efflux RND transporter periplasmic adaptor subunit n=1 Tax=Sphingomonas cavernae TaxID=2320861 RepID=A0A418WNY6_9SPHN|nr:efflux RND transporter periplasmic adaptor subunit [Sphingomonas cavernae]RJF92948.1 efflux RND transporter periplasmic adaptor subunit [Sphingomonas cavernae]